MADEIRGQSWMIATTAVMFALECKRLSGVEYRLALRLWRQTIMVRRLELSMMIEQLGSGIASREATSRALQKLESEGWLTKRIKGRGERQDDGSWYAWRIQITHCIELWRAQVVRDYGSMSRLAKDVRQAKIEFQRIGGDGVKLHEAVEQGRKKSEETRQYQKQKKKEKPIQTSWMPSFITEVCNDAMIPASDSWTKKLYGQAKNWIAECREVGEDPRAKLETVVENWERIVRRGITLPSGTRIDPLRKAFSFELYYKYRKQIDAMVAEMSDGQVSASACTNSPASVKAMAPVMHVRRNEWIERVREPDGNLIEVRTWPLTDAGEEQMREECLVNTKSDPEEILDWMEENGFDVSKYRPARKEA